MAETRQLVNILAFYLLAQLPAMAVWQSQALPEKLKILLGVLLIGLATILVAENYRRKLGLSLSDIGLRLPSPAGALKNTAPVLGAAAAGLAWFAAYFALFRLLLPDSYAALLAEAGGGLVKSFLEWGKSGSLTGLMVLFSGHLLLAAAEEFLFRGVIYNYLLRSMSWQKALLWSSAAFTLIHFNYTGFPIYFVGGVLYGLLYRRSGSLLAASAAHFLYNFLLVMLGEHLVAGV